MAALSDDDANDKNSTDNASMPPSLQDDGSNLISIEEFEGLCLRRFEEGDAPYLTLLVDQMQKMARTGQGDFMSKQSKQVMDITQRISSPFI